MEAKNSSMTRNQFREYLRYKQTRKSINDHLLDVVLIMAETLTGAMLHF